MDLSLIQREGQEQLSFLGISLFQCVHHVHSLALFLLLTIVNIVFKSDGMKPLTIMPLKSCKQAKNLHLYYCGQHVTSLQIGAMEE